MTERYDDSPPPPLVEFLISTHWTADEVVRHIRESAQNGVPCHTVDVRAAVEHGLTVDEMILFVRIAYDKPQVHAKFRSVTVP